MDIKKFQQLMAEGDLEQAKSMLEEFLAGQLSAEQRGEALLAMATMRIEAENTLNREYVAILNYALSQLKEQEKEQTVLADRLNLAKARKQLGGP